MLSAVLAMGWQIVDTTPAESAMLAEHGFASGRVQVTDDHNSQRESTGEDAVKRAIELIDILRNDMNRIVESQCREHGRPGPAPSLSACLLPLVASETIGALITTQTGSRPMEPREFLAFVGQVSGDQRYSRLAGPVFGLFRHGIAHNFMPKRYTLPGTSLRARGASLWTQQSGFVSECTDWLRSPEGAHRLAFIRDTRHLIVRRGQDGDLEVCVSPIDVDAALARVRDALMGRDIELSERVAANHARWVARVEQMDARWINSDEEAYLRSHA